MKQGLFDEYTPQGKRTIQMGLFFILLWSIIYIITAAFRIVVLKTVSLWMTVPFLIFGIICIMTGLYYRKDRKKKSLLKSHDHLIVGFLLVETLAAILVFYYAIAHGKIQPAFIIADSAAVILSAMTFYLYFGLHNGREIISKSCTRTIVLAAILSHLAWAYFIRLLV